MSAAIQPERPFAQTPTHMCTMGHGHDPMCTMGHGHDSPMYDSPRIASTKKHGINVGTKRGVGMKKSVGTSRVRCGIKLIDQCMRNGQNQAQVKNTRLLIFFVLVAVHPGSRLPVYMVGARGAGGYVWV